MEEPGLLRRRTGRWIRVRIEQLLNIKSRLRAAVVPEDEES